MRDMAERDDGITVVEFGLVAPIFLLMLIGMMDLSHTAYTKSVLNGAVQAAARDASLEDAATSVIDADILDVVEIVAPGAVVSTTRTSYIDFADISRPETFDDDDNSGECDNGEGYVDENNNGQWDSDLGTDGNGGASDVVLYTVELTYDRPFAMPLIPGIEQQTLKSTTLRKNQPFAAQAGAANEAGTCD